MFVCNQNYQSKNLCQKNPLGINTDKPIKFKAKIVFQTNPR
jgi:hypothetical protein